MNFKVGDYVRWKFDTRQNFSIKSFGVVISIDNFHFTGMIKIKNITNVDTVTTFGTVLSKFPENLELVSDEEIMIYVLEQ